MADFRNLDLRVEEFLSVAGNDVAQILSKMEFDEGISGEMLCDNFDCDFEDLEDMMNADLTGISLSTFAAILIASGKVLRIENMQAPVVEERRTQQMPQRDARGRFIRQQPQSDVTEERRTQQMPQRDARGRFIRQQPQTENTEIRDERPFNGAPEMQHQGRGMFGMPEVACQRIDLDGMTREELVDFAHHVGASNRIDLGVATRSQIIRMLEEMGDNRHMIGQQAPRQCRRNANNTPVFCETAPVHAQRPCGHVCGERNQTPSRETEPQTEQRECSTRERLNELVETISNNPNALNRLIEVLGL